jgi:hypothetical protein
MLSQPLTNALESGREDFNQRFVLVRRVFPQLNGEYFSNFIATYFDPLICAVSSENPAAVAKVVSVAYDAALDLVGQNLVGQSARSSWLNRLWEQMPQFSSWIATAPSLVLPALCNGLHNIVAAPGSRPQQWLDSMGQVAALCECVDQFLCCGQICAWRAGLPEYRSAALDLLKKLPENLVRVLLCVAEEFNVADVLSRLMDDPWYDPGGRNDAPAWRIAASVGAFSGFEGHFIAPPQVIVRKGQFMVYSNGQCWQLQADLFGTTFIRMQGDDVTFINAAKKFPQGVAVDGELLRRRGESINLAGLGDITSAAVNKHTLAVTSRLSHAVQLIPIS